MTGLPPAVGQAVYRVTQESVTNSHRHARHATRIHVEVTGATVAVQLVVSDDGVRTTEVGDHDGFGLTGMAERVALPGGTTRPDSTRSRRSGRR